MHARPLQTDELLRIAGRMARFGGWSVDLEQGLVLWSDEVCRIHGEPPGTTPTLEEAFGYIPEEWQELVRGHFRRCVGEGIPYDLEMEILTREGRRAWVRTVGEPVAGPGGDIQRVQGAFQDITSRKRAEAEIHGLESRLLQTLENLPDGFVTIDRDWRFTYLNRAASEILGRPREELLGKGVWDEYPGGMGTPFHEAYDRALREGRTVRVEAYFPPLGRWVREHVYPTEEGLALYVQDVTRARETRAQLQASEERLREATRAAGVGVFDRHLAGEGSWVSDSLWELYGMEPRPTDLSQENFLDRVHPEDREDVMAHAREALAAGDTYESEFRVIRPDGQVRWLSAGGRVTRDGNGKPVRLVGAVTDVTHRKEAEEALRESELRFRQLAESIESVFWIRTGDRSRIEYVSPAYATIWGRDPGKLYQDPALWREALHQEDRARVTEALERPPGDSYELEYRVVRPDGSVRWIWDRTWQLRDEEGRVIRVLGIAHDVTDRRALEAQLRHGQKMEVVGQLAGGVAHDFNNILTVVRASSEILLEDLPPDSPLRETAAEIRGQAERGATLTRQLLAFSRRQVLDERVMDLWKVLRAMRPALRRVISERIEIHWERKGADLLVKADPGQLQQVVLNLVVNAADAIVGPGTISLMVDEVTESNDEPASRDDSGGEGLSSGATGQSYVRLAVRDTGQGIPREHLDRLFEPFFTTKLPGRGTGLGLPMVYGVVKQSGGKLLVESEPGAGSTFQVLLPRVEAGSATSPEQRSVPSAPAPSVSGTILLVEDDDAVRHVSARVLARNGFRVLEASGGPEAIDLLARLPGGIDLVVSDLVMPGMDGVVLLGRLRELVPDLPVILMSGYSSEELSHQARERATAFLDKPFHPGRLTRVVREAMRSVRRPSHDP